MAVSQAMLIVLVFLCCSPTIAAFSPSHQRASLCSVVEVFPAVPSQAELLSAGTVAGVVQVEGSLIYVSYNGSTTLIDESIDTFVLGPTDIVAWTRRRRLRWVRLSNIREVNVVSVAALPQTIWIAPDASFIMFGGTNGGLYSINMTNQHILQISPSGDTLAILNVSFCSSSKYALYSWLTNEQTVSLAYVLLATGVSEVVVQGAAQINHYSWAADCSAFAFIVQSRLTFCFPDVASVSSGGTLISFPLNISNVYWGKNDALAWTVGAGGGLLRGHILSNGLIETSAVTSPLGPAALVEPFDPKKSIFTQVVTSELTMSVATLPASITRIGLPNGLGTISRIIASPDGSFCVFQARFAGLSELWQIDLKRLTTPVRIHPALTSLGQQAGDVVITSQNHVVFLLTRQAGAPEIWVRKDGSSKRVSRPLDFVASYSVSQNGIHLIYTTPNAPFVFSLCLVEPLVYSGEATLQSGIVVIPSDLSLDSTVSLTVYSGSQALVLGVARIDGNLHMIADTQGHIPILFASAVLGTFNQFSVVGSGQYAGSCMYGSVSYGDTNITVFISQQFSCVGFQGWIIGLIVGISLLSIPFCIVGSIYCRRRHDEQLANLIGNGSTSKKKAKCCIN